MSIPEQVWQRLTPRDKIVYWYVDVVETGTIHYLMSLTGKVAADIYRKHNGDCILTCRSWIGRIERNFFIEMDNFDECKQIIDDMITKTQEFRILTERESALL